MIGCDTSEEINARPNPDKKHTLHCNKLDKEQTLSSQLECVISSDVWAGEARMENIRNHNTHVTTTTRYCIVHCNAVLHGVSGAWTVYR